MSTEPSQRIQKTIRIIMHLYGNRGYSFMELSERFELCEGALRSYLKTIEKMNEFDLTVTKVDKLQPTWIYRIRPETSLYAKELKQMKKYGLCG